MTKCMLIPLLGDGENRNEEFQLPFMPRVGDHIEMDDPKADEGTALMFRVIAIAYQNDKSVEYVDVYLRPAEPLAQMIKAWTEA